MSSFESDPFISYAHADNEPWAPEHDRWISSFHTALETRLRELLGRPPTIWRDNKLKCTDDLAKLIQKIEIGTAPLLEHRGHARGALPPRQ